MDTPTTSNRAVRRTLWTLLITATLASTAANVTHAVMLRGVTHAAIGPVAFSILPPVALLGLFHLMGVWSGARRSGTVFWVFLAAVLALAAAAFRLSFAAVRDLAESYGYGRADAALFPLILDGLIAVCTIGLVAVTRPRISAVQPVAAPPPAVNPPVMQPLDNAAAQPVTHAVNQPVAHAMTQPVTQAVNQPMSSVDAVEHLPAVQPDSEVDPPTELLRLALVDRTAESADHTAEQPVDHTTGQSLDHPVDHHDPNQPVDHRALAARAVGSGSSTWTTEQLETVSRAGKTVGQRPLADRLGVSPATVARMRKALAAAADSA